MEAKESLGKLIGTGNTAEIFEFGNGKVCKLFKEKEMSSLAELEFRNSLVFCGKGLDSPKCHGMVEVNGRPGIVYDLIKGESLLDWAFRTQEFERALRMMVCLQKKYIAFQEKNVTDYRDYLRWNIPEQETEIRKKIDAFPEGFCLCHGDLHMMNIMITSEEKAMVINFMNVCRAPREYEIARTYYFLSSGGMDEPDSEETRRIRKTREIICQKYLSEMETRLEDLKEYLEVITVCHRYETGLEKR